MANRRCSKCNHLNAITAKRCGGCDVIFADLAEENEAAIPSTCQIHGCKFPPGYSTSTSGGGKFLCRHHALASDEQDIAEIARNSYVVEPDDGLERAQREADAYLKANGLTYREGESRSAWLERLKTHRKGLKAAPPSKAWAFDVLERARRGEPLSPLAVRLAKEATHAEEA